MCIVCNSAFSRALQGLSFPTRRQVLAAATAGAGAFAAEAAGFARAAGATAEAPLARAELPPVSIFVAEKIITRSPVIRPRPQLRSKAQRSSPPGRLTM